MSGATTPQSVEGPQVAWGNIARLAVSGFAAVGALAAVRLAPGKRGTGSRRVARASVEKRDLGETMPDCPPTLWNADNIDLANLPDVNEEFPLFVDASEVDVKTGEEETYFEANRETIREQLTKHGVLVFRNFDLMKDKEGFRTWYESLQLNPCLDPIHTSGLRAFVGKKDAVYEAVNKKGLAGHLVGMHNESTFVKTATFGAFVCFHPASDGGGEFLIVDGAKIIKDMDPAVLKRIVDRKVRISVSNLDLNFVNVFPDGLQSSVRNVLSNLIFKVVAPKFDMDLEMVYNADSSNPNRLQAIEHAQSPINTHPVTGKPVWFCNIHNHSRYLRDRRPCTVPEVGMTDVYYGDLGRIPPEDVDHINEVMERNIVPIMMGPGDVVLIDNYRALHGRNTFKGDRMHAVSWFESIGEANKSDDADRKPGDLMNTLVNKVLVGE